MKLKNRFSTEVIYLVSENMMFQDQPSSWSVVGLCVCHFCFTFGFRISVSISSYLQVTRFLVSLSLLLLYHHKICIQLLH